MKIISRLKPIYIIISIYFIILCACSPAQTPIAEKFEASIVETCYYFTYKPKGTKEEHIQKAYNIFKNVADQEGITILDSMINNKRACFLSTEEIDIDTQKFVSSDRIVYYLLTAFFNEKNRSVYELHEDNISREQDKYSLLQKLDVLNYIDEGVVIEGDSALIVLFKNYLDKLGIPYNFGNSLSGQLILTISGMNERISTIPFLWEQIDFIRFVTARAGDMSLIHGRPHNSVNDSLTLYINGWTKQKVPYTYSSENTITFKKSVLSLPFNEDQIMSYFYTLKRSSYWSDNKEIFYAPQYVGAQVDVSVGLNKAMVTIDSDAILTPERIFMWMAAAVTIPPTFSYQFLANLLSLKMAKRLYTGLPTFLGGEDLFKRTQEIPFESIRSHTMLKGNVAVTGNITKKMYLKDSEFFGETTVFRSIEETEPFKAYFASWAKEKDVLISFVARSGNYTLEKQQVIDILTQNNLPVIFQFSEQISAKDGWYAVSIVVPADKEKQVVAMYEQRIKQLNPTISLGVYRVSKEEINKEE